MTNTWPSTGGGIVLTEDGEDDCTEYDTKVRGVPLKIQDLWGLSKPQSKSWSQPSLPFNTQIKES